MAVGFVMQELSLVPLVLVEVPLEVLPACSAPGNCSLPFG